MSAILFDLYPARVSITPVDHQGELVPTAQFQMNAARIILTNDEILVATDSPTGPILALRLPYAPGEATFAKRSGQVLTTTGQMLDFAKDESCGCGSRLRSWNPYPNITA